MAVSESTFKRVAVEDDGEPWEWVCGQLRRKPAMTMEHNSVTAWLGVLIQNQLPRRQFQIRVNAGHIKAASSYLIPDVAVVPTELAQTFSGR
ncbi:MAG: hypothetical protein C0506_09160, partial [Anaerolinea sp.]|nr:hypothetical protein [Anaerolinea sp.]